MAARRLLTRGPNPLEPPEAQPQTVPVGKRTALKVQEKVAPRRAGIRATCRSCSAAAHAKSEGGEPVRYYLGVDWADQTHAVWVVDERGTKLTARTVPHTAEGLSAWGRELDEWRAQGIALWAAIERPEGRVVDFLLDHGVVVYPVNPKALDRARDRFRQSGAKDDPFDARVLAVPTGLQHGSSVHGWGLTSWGRGPAAGSGGARAEGVDVAFP
jgi:Transposase